MVSERDDSRAIEEYRSYLMLLARLQVEERLRPKVDVSGVVQQTLFEAFREIERFLGLSADQRLAWLRRVLANNLADEVRKQRAEKRDVGRERSLERTLDASIQRIAGLAADQSTPSARMMREERSLALARALDRLPPEQRRVVELHHLEGRSLADTAEIMKKSKPAIAGLLHRGLKRLREILEGKE